MSRWAVILLGIATWIALHYHEKEIKWIALASGIYFMIAVGCAILVHALYFFTSPTFRIPRMILFGGIVMVFVYYYKYGVLPFDWYTLDRGFVYVAQFFSLLSGYL
ncbi:MAG TPA: hypothetical protein VEP90_01675 [Methylomirabilota bacterium]|nr:hypothetical protein [Methylomirabilota bacterium]